jgi:hypothetical protein
MKEAVEPQSVSWISSEDVARREVVRIGEQSMREAPGVNGVPSQFERSFVRKFRTNVRSWMQ